MRVGRCAPGEASGGGHLRPDGLAAAGTGPDSPRPGQAVDDQQSTAAPRPRTRRCGTREVGAGIGDLHRHCTLYLTQGYFEVAAGVAHGICRQLAHDEDHVIGHRSPRHQSRGGEAAGFADLRHRCEKGPRGRHHRLPIPRTARVSRNHHLSLPRCWAALGRRSPGSSSICTCRVWARPVSMCPAPQWLERTTVRRGSRYGGDGEASGRRNGSSSPHST